MEDVTSSRGGRWIVWGIGEPVPDTFFQVEVGNQRAAAVAADADPEWMRSSEGWSVVLSADEVTLEEWVRRHGSVRGYAEYDAIPLDESIVDEPKPVEQRRPY